MHVLHQKHTLIQILARQLIIKTTLPYTHPTSTITKSVLLHVSEYSRLCYLTPTHIQKYPQKSIPPVSTNKNTWITNLPLQIFPKANHCSRCTKTQQHLVHQNTLWPQFARQVFLQAMSRKSTVETSSFMQLSTVHISTTELTLNHITARQQTKTNALPGTIPQ